MCGMKAGVLAVMLALGLGAMTAPAWGYEDQDRARERVRAGEFQSLSRIKRQLESQFRGRVLDVQLSPRSSGRGATYDVKMLTRDGDVLMVETDARTGKVLGVRGRR